MTSRKTNKTMFGNRRGVSPILATVLLLGITVVGGGLAYSLMAQGSNAASSQTIITLENAQAVKGTSHADMTATVKNGGSVPWKTLEMTVTKSELSEPLLYESLHENAAGCTASALTSGTCSATGSAKSGSLDNPLRMQWLASLNKGVNPTDTAVDNGEGISVGRKFVISTADESYRSIQILNGTWVAKAFGDTSSNAGSNNLKNANGDIVSCNAATSGTTWVGCGHVFAALGTGVSVGLNTGGTAGEGIPCREDQTLPGAIECKVFTHGQLTAPVQPGASVQLYADAFTKPVAGLNNQFVQTGDGLVVNLVAIGENGSTARYQTVIKVVGI